MDCPGANIRIVVSWNFRKAGRQEEKPKNQAIKIYRKSE
jgi:hypothetical protein